MLELEYSQDKPMLRAIESKGKFLSKMGQGRKDGHYFHPEEALYLVEKGSAVVKCQGKLLPLRQVYAIACAGGISLMKYSSYSQLVRAGYNVRRAVPNTAPQASTSGGDPTKMIPMTAKSFRFPDELLNQFPNMAANRRSVDIPGVKMLNDVPLLGEIHPRELTQAHRQGMSSYCIYSMGQRDNFHWATLRPVRWPLFESLRNASNWKVYEKERGRLLKLPPQRIKYSSTATEKRLTHDYDVFNTVGLNVGATPNYRLLVIDERFKFEMPDAKALSQLAKESVAPLLIASGPPSKVCMHHFTAETDESLSPYQAME